MESRRGAPQWRDVILAGDEVNCLNQLKTRCLILVKAALACSGKSPARFHSGEALEFELCGRDACKNRR